MGFYQCGSSLRVAERDISLACGVIPKYGENE
jgi:hypothetical protein